MILDNPYCTVTDDQGNFEIKNVPAGSQKVTVWQEAVGPVTASSGQEINIKPNDTSTQDFTIDPTKVSRTALQNAASIAGLLLTTEALIVEKKEKEAPHAGGPPGGGMGGMY